MKLHPLSREDLEQVRLWRNELMPAWRTPYMLTAEQQEDFYKTVICDRRSNLRYWAFWEDKQPADHFAMVGMGGIENIQWENGLGEISVIIDPGRRCAGLGAEAVRLILNQAFNYLGLKTVFAECYHCNEALGFWRKMEERYQAGKVILPDRKYWAGVYWDADYITFSRDMCASLL